MGILILLIGMKEIVNLSVSTNIKWTSSAIARFNFINIGF